MSISTASRVVRGLKNVDPGTSIDVSRVVARLGYSPNLVGRGLRRRRTDVVGFIAHDLRDPEQVAVMGGIEQRLRDKGLGLMPVDRAGRIPLDPQIDRFLREGRVDAVIVLGATGDSRRLQAVPTIHIGADRARTVHSIVWDHRRAVENAVTHLAQHGIRKFVVVQSSPFLDRLAAHVTHARPNATHLRIVGTIREEGHRSLQRLIGNLDARAVIITADVPSLLLVAKLMRSDDRSPCRRPSVVACGTIPSIRAFDRSMAWIDRDAVSMGRLAADAAVVAMGGRRQSGIALEPRFTCGLELAGSPNPS